MLKSHLLEVVFFIIVTLLLYYCYIHLCILRDFFSFSSSFYVLYFFKESYDILYFEFKDVLQGRHIFIIFNIFVFKIVSSLSNDLFYFIVRVRYNNCREFFPPGETFLEKKNNNIIYGNI